MNSDLFLSFLGVIASGIGVYECWFNKYYSSDEYITFVEERHWLLRSWYLSKTWFWMSRIVSAILFIVFVVNFVFELVKKVGF